MWHARVALAGRLAGGLLVMLIVSLVPCSPAWGHALLVDSDPASGAVYDSSPALAQLWYSEDLQPMLSSVRLLGEDGQALAGVSVIPDTTHPDLLQARLPDVSPGTYGLWWQVTALDDGHTNQGVVVFSVGATASDATASEAAGRDGSVQGILRWLSLLALVGSVGVLVIARVVLAPAGAALSPAGTSYRQFLDTVRHRLAVLVFAAAVLGLGVAAVDLGQQGRLSAAVTGGPGLLDELTGTRWGVQWSLRAGAYLLLVLLMVRVVRRGPGRPPALRAGVGWACVLVLVTDEAWASHASGATDPTVTVAADALHVAAACIWLGGLAALLVVLTTRPGDTADRRRLIRQCRGRFSSLLAGSLVAIVITGLFAAGRQVRDVSDLWTTAYGRLVLVKVSLLAVLAAIGAFNSARLHERLVGWRTPKPDRLPARPIRRRWVGAELVVGGIALGVVAALAGTAPPQGGDATPAYVSEQVSASRHDLVVSVSASPGRVGDNGFTVIVASTRRPAPAPVRGVDLAMPGPTGPRVTPLRHIAPDTWFGLGTVTDRRVNLVVSVDRGGGALRIPVSWNVQPPAVNPAGHRLVGVTTPLALAVLVLAVVTGLAVFAGRRRVRPDAQVDLRSRQRSLTR